MPDLCEFIFQLDNASAGSAHRVQLRSVSFKVAYIRNKDHWKCQQKWQIRILGYDLWKMYVFSWRRKIGSDGAVATSLGSYTWDPEKYKIRPPTAERLKVGTTKRLVLADRIEPADWEDQLHGQTIQDTAVPCHAEISMSGARFHTEGDQALYDSGDWSGATIHNVSRFSNFFHYRPTSPFVTKSLPEIPPHLKRVATLPCEISRHILLTVVNGTRFASLYRLNGAIHQRATQPSDQRDKKNVSFGRATNKITLIDIPLSRACDGSY